MPCVDLHSMTDFASIYYTTNTSHSNVGGFDPEKPTIVILHPVFLDSTWLDLQLGDSRLNAQFNVIAFDMRSCGRSECRPTGRHDSWVDAADLAFCFQKLHLAPSHIVALEGTSIYCALRFAVLFSEMCLSLTLVNVPAPFELEWICKNLDDLVRAFCFADDLESFEHAAFECIEFLFGPNSDPDLVDELISFWEMNHAPLKRARTAETMSVYINRSPLNPETYASITQPVLIIQGEKNELCPMKYAERLVSQLTGVEDGAIIYTVKGGTSMLSVVPGNASIVNRAVTKFLTRLPHHRSDIIPPETSIKDRMRTALSKLSEITGNPDIASLDPLCSLSFSSLTPAVLKGQTERLKHYQKDAWRAFSPISMEGRPLRRYSQKEREEWSHSEKGRIFMTSTTVIPPERGKDSSGRVLRPSSHSVFQQPSGGSPLLNTAFTIGTTEKHVLKETKVAGNTSSTPLQRLMS